MTRRDVVLLFGLSLVVRLAVAVFISRPGYMDPSYYAAGAVNLAEGGGLDEPFIWNYLDDPVGIPHVGFLYWMPLPSLLAALPAALFPGSFLALQVPFALLSALLPLVGYGVAWRATGVRRQAWTAGLLTLFSGHFFRFWALPESFAPFALFGSLAVWLAGREWQVASGRWWISLSVGLLAGLAHLTRADGILLLPVVVFAPLLFPSSKDHASRIAHHISRLALRHGLLVLLGYLLAMGPWFARNLAVVGTPLASGGAKTLWLTTYDDLYCYGCELSPQAYLAWGWGNILHSKLDAAVVNLERFLAENCLVFLLPFVVIGFYRLRRRLVFVLAFFYLILVYTVHSLAFTYPGPRGGFFHASAPALPFLFAAGVEGLAAAVNWLGRRRHWNLPQARAVFGWAAVVGAVAFSIYTTGVVLPDWRGVDRTYQEIGDWMEQQGVGKDVVVVVNNPPGFWYHTRRPAVAVPASAGGVDVLLAAADRYGASYVVLDRNWPAEELPHRRLLPVAEWGAGDSRVVLYEVAR